MRRKTLDMLLSSTGAIIAIVLLVAGGLLAWAANFASGTVSDQLSAQRITMPTGQQIENPKIKPFLEQYAGTQLDSGDKAKAYADHYIAVHMEQSSEGKTYSEVSTAYNANLRDEAKAGTEETKKLGELRQSLFMGDSLRSMLLTAYAFGTLGKIASIASIVAFVGGAVMALLAGLGFVHSKKAGEAVV